MLSKEAIEEFKKIYKQKFKEDLNDDEVFRKASKLLELYKAIYGLASFSQRKEKEIKIIQNEQQTRTK